MFLIVMTVLLKYFTDCSIWVFWITIGNWEAVPPAICQFINVDCTHADFFVCLYAGCCIGFLHPNFFTQLVQNVIQSFSLVIFEEV